MSRASESVERPFRYLLRVRFGECDAQKVVFNVHYGTYIDLAAIEFLRTLGLGPLLFHGPLDYQLVKQTIEWRASAHFDEVMELAVHADSLGNTSFTLHTVFRISGSDAILATAETVYVLVDAQTLVKTPLTNELRTALGHGATGMVVDHADSTPRRERAE